MDFYFISIFPELFGGVLDTGVLGIASRKGLARYNVINLRDFAVDSHGSVDDYPYGGGPGMVMMAPPVVEAVESVRGDGDEGDVRVIMLSPAGKLFDQDMARELSSADKIIFVCGRYKGVDERVRDLVVTDAISIGDYIVSGGELPSLVIADSIVRNFPGVLGDERSRDTDSFDIERGRSLDAAYYTRPPEYRGMEVPEVLISGDHARIDRWRKSSALERTKKFRPDLSGSE
ncbi:MAG: tRNA (guanosine(37)-N1)-methyltransferase TrmD [Candidatus Krumholzibacteriota bacterium]|nr:tRNA (guanosine(37)-N1)-methyltransferase TrmD [Candidatus Krumholzibacteriota bacterium]